MQEDRLMIFIDGANVLKGWSTYCFQNKIQKRVDYGKLIEHLSSGHKLIRPYFYDAVPDPQTGNKFKFLDKLHSLGITISTKIVQKRNKSCKKCGATDIVDVQKGVDVALVTDLMSLCFEDAYDLAIVVSGDNDFSDAVKYIKSKGKKCWVAAFKGSLSGELKRTCDRVIAIDDIIDNVSLD